MPVYLFSCQKCGDFEKFLPIDFPSNVYPACPDCNDHDVAKVFLSPGIAFKGKGFYTTDK